MKYKKTFLFIFTSLLFACSDENLIDKEQHHLQKTEEYLLKQNYEHAAIEVKNAIKLNPKNPKSRWLYGKVLSNISNYKPAVKEMKLAAKLCQKGDDTVLITSCGISANFSLILSKSLYYMGDLEAIFALKEYDKSSTTKAALYAIKSLASTQKGELEQSNNYLSQAVSFDPTSYLVRVSQAQYLFATEPEESLKVKTILRQVITEEPTNELAWGVLADIENYLGNTDAAIKAFTKVIELSPQQFSFRFKRALAFIKLNKFKEAQKDTALLLKANEVDPRANFVQGILYFNEKKYQAALQALELSLPITNNYPIIYFYSSLGNAYLDQVEQAYRHANKYYSHNPTSMSAVKLLALAQINNGMHEDAENLLAAEVNDTTEDSGLLTLLFNSLIKQEKADEAFIISLRLKKLQPSNSSSQLKLAAELLSKGNVNKGLPLLEERLIAKPSSYQIIEVLVDSYLKKGDIDAASNVIETYNLADINLASFHFLNGRILLAKGDRLSAIKEFSAAAKLKQGDPEINQQLAQLAIASKEYIVARKYLSTILESNKNHLSTLLNVAALEVLEKNESAMKATLELAIKTHPKAIEPRLILSRYYLVKEQPEKVSNLLKTINGKDRERPEVLLEIGLAEIAEGNYSAASYTLENLTLKDANNPVSYLSLAKAYMGLEKYTKAMEVLDKALAIDDTFLPARLKKAQLLIHSKKQQQAEKEMSYLRTRLDGDVKLLSLEVALANLKGDFATVLTLAEQLYKIEPIQQNMLKLVRARVQTDKPEQAISLLLNWLQEHTADILSRKVLAELYHRTDQKSKADEQYKLIYD